MRVLVVGTSGQLATELHRGRRSAAIELIAPQRFDVSDRSVTEAMLERARPGVVVNASAFTAVDLAESEAERAFGVNEKGPSYLARWCERRNSALLHVSTSHVFDGTKTGAYTERDEPHPLGVYGASKLAGEQRIRQDLGRHIVLRTSWVFSSHGQNFVKTMLRLADQGSELRVVADQFGRPTAAADLAAALWFLVELVANGRELQWGTYHFAGAGPPVSSYEFARAIVGASATGATASVTPVATTDYLTLAQRPANAVLDTTLFERTFGRTPAPWIDGLQAVKRELGREAAEP
jgi:dTDP-4-dehydrorhamnose reductase